MRWALLAAFVGCIGYLLGATLDLAWLRMLCKPLPILALLLWTRQAAPGPYRRWIGLGLGLSLIGDVLLEWPFQAFIPGLGAFLLAHLAYLTAYLSDTRRLAPIALVISALLGSGLFILLNRHGLGDLLVPIALYSLTISAMLWRALARLGAHGLGTTSPALAAVGALLFVSSDSMIGISRFIGPFEGADLAIMLTYWIGQFAIAASANLRHHT